MLKRTYEFSTEKGIKAHIKATGLKGVTVRVSDQGHMQPSGGFIFQEIEIVMDATEVAQLIKALTDVSEGYR